MSNTLISDEEILFMLDEGIAENNRRFGGPDKQKISVPDEIILQIEKDSRDDDVGISRQEIIEFWREQLVVHTQDLRFRNSDIISDQDLKPYTTRAYILVCREEDGLSIAEVQWGTTDNVIEIF